MINFQILGQVKIENYSQTHIRLTDMTNLTEYFFDKKFTKAYTNDQSLQGGEYIYIKGVEYGESFVFFSYNVVFPIAITVQDLLHIINGWCYGSVDITVDDIEPSIPLSNTLNFIQGSNITITVVEDIDNSKTDVTIDASGGGGGVTNVTATSPITSTGGATPNISTQVAKGKLIGRNSVTTGVMEEISVGSGLLLSGTILTTTAVSPIYLVAYDRNSQTAGGANTGYPMTFDTLVERNDITFSSSSAVRFNSDGVYNVQFSAQFANYDNREHDVDIWFVLNRTPINWSNSRFSIASTHGGTNGHYVAAWNYMSTFSIGDELEIYWQTDDTQVQIEKISASGDAPDTPSIILTIDKL